MYILCIHDMNSTASGYMLICYDQWWLIWRKKVWKYDKICTTWTMWSTVCLQFPPSRYLGLLNQSLLHVNHVNQSSISSSPTGEAVVQGTPRFVLCPYTLHFTPGGRVTFAETIDPTLPNIRNFLSPEVLSGHLNPSDVAVEKVWQNLALF